MSNSILQRIFTLADNPPNADACQALGTIARKLSASDGPVDKAHTIARVLRDWEPVMQDRMLQAVEGIAVASVAVVPEQPK